MILFSVQPGRIARSITHRAKNGVLPHVMALIIASTSFAATPPAPQAGDADPPAKTAAEVIDEAHDAMEVGDFERASVLYGQVRNRLPEIAEIPYNQAIAEYRRGEFKRAAELFEQAARLAEQTDLRNRATYNLGNSVYQQSLQASQAEGDPTDVMQQIDRTSARMEEALGHFKRAIHADPNDEDARHNAELTHKLLKQLQQMKEQLRQQQQQEQEEQSNEDQEQEQQPSDQEQNSTDQQRADAQQRAGENEDDTDQQPQDQSEQPPRDDEQPPQAGEDDSREDQQETSQPPQGEGDEQQDDRQASPQAEDQEDRQREPMSRDQAERLLQSVRDKERQRREELARRQARNQPPVEKDW